MGKLMVCVAYDNHPSYLKKRLYCMYTVCPTHALTFPVSPRVSAIDLTEGFQS